MDTCCICLESSKPLHLLACGCKIAWFHQACENEWISNSEYPYACPTCRRPVPMNTNYCFSYEIGYPQKLLWGIVGLFSVESLICIVNSPYVEKLWIFPVQTAAILLCPFMFPTTFTYFTFLHNAAMNMYFKSTIIIFYGTTESLGSLVDFLCFLSYLHVLTLYGIHIGGYRYFSKMRIDFLEPYAISREVKHV